jgi:hypothetical protein
LSSCHIQALVACLLELDGMPSSKKLHLIEGHNIVASMFTDAGICMQSVAR